jgi:hypothetical protein
MHQNSHIVRLAALLGALTVQAARAQCTYEVFQYESPVGVSRGVRAFATHDDGRGLALFVGGSISHVNADRMPTIPRWEGSAIVPVARPTRAVYPFTT